MSEFEKVEGSIARVWDIKGFQQPLKAHEHWHIDVTYLNLGGTFYYLSSVLDGF